MPLASGMAAQLGFITESVWGTYVAPTKFVPLVSESLAKDIARLESAGIIAGQRVLRSQQWAPGNVTASGDVQLEVYDRTMATLLRHMFGGVSTSGAGPYTHTFTPGDLADDSMTIQVGRPDVAGTVQPFSYTGCKIESWEMACAAGEIATLGLSVTAKDETTAQALAAATYATGIKPMTFIGGSLTIAGSAVNTKSVTLGCNLGLNTGRRFLGAGTISQQLEAALRGYTGTVQAEFESLTAYNRFINGTEAALVFALVSGSETITFTCNVRFDGKTPNIEGRDITELELPFKVIGTTTDALGITAVFVSSVDVTA